ncbi:MAG: efflux RND transporter periplasmic adaptor subunit [bacterium]|nr:efflux RND transporter periplasmic adaptor subunit [bacterium]
MIRWKLILPIIAIGVAALGGVALLVTAPEVDQIERPAFVRAVRVVEVEAQALPLIVHSQGTVAPRTESELVPEVSGRIVWSSPALVSGGFFREGESLLRLDRDDYETALARARASLERAKGEWEHAKATLERREELARQGVASSSQLDDARRQGRVSAAALDEAELALRQARRDLDRTEIRAPFDGRVRIEHVDVGQFLSRGQSVATLYATDYVEIRLPIPDSELAYLDLPLFAGATLAEGPTVTLRAHFAGSSHTWRGRIVRTEGEIDPKSRMVHAVARVEDPYATSEGGAPLAGVSDGGAPLAVGLFVEAEIEGPIAENVLRVPRGALRDRNYLLVVGADDRLQKLEVELLRLERDDALVRATLPPGGRVCVSQVAMFVPGMKVDPQPVTPPQDEHGPGEETHR